MYPFCRLMERNSKYDCDCQRARQWAYLFYLHETIRELCRSKLLIVVLPLPVKVTQPGGLLYSGYEEHTALSRSIPNKSCIGPVAWVRMIGDALTLSSW